jgi:tetratricopeptide (TPR) repeat protein
MTWNRHIAAGLTAAFLIATAGAQKSDKAEVLFESARQKEMLEGNLESAIKQYKEVVAKYGSHRAVAAKALVRMGQCYEKLGDAEARKAYERVVREFGDQKDLAETARTRLAALGQAGGLGRPSGITLRKVWGGTRGTVEGSPSPDGRHLSLPTGRPAILPCGTW